MTHERKMDLSELRSEIAIAAARMIAEEGASYEFAKKKAARQITGRTRIRGDILPDNDAIENELRLYNALFLTDSQPARLLHLRQLALQMMKELEQFRPYLTGAVLNGTAGEHTDIHLQLFTENAKDVEIFLLNKHIDISVTEPSSYNEKNQPAEIIHLYLNKEIFHLSVYNPDDLRKMVRATDAQAEKADIQKLETLIKEQISQNFE